MYGISCFQLLPELVGHDIKILRINDGRHPVSHGCEFFPAEPQEFKQPVIGVNYGKISIKPAPEHRSRNVVIQVEHFRLRTLLCRNIHADRYDRRPPVFSHYSASHVMNPDVRTILFFMRYSTTYSTSSASCSITARSTISRSSGCIQLETQPSISATNSASSA